MKQLQTTFEPALAYWRNLSARERLILGGGAIVVAILLFVALIWSPVRQDLARLRKAVPEGYQQLQWMRAEAPRVQQLKSSTASTQGGSLLSLVERSTKTLESQATVKLDAEGQNAVRLAIDGVAFNDLVNWLADLQKQGGVRVDTASLDPQSAPGIVNVRLLLRAGGS